jgi:hypothetical protein
MKRGGAIGLATDHTAAFVFEQLGRKDQTKRGRLRGAGRRMSAIPETRMKRRSSRKNP